MAPQNDTSQHEAWRDPVTHPAWRWICLGVLAAIAILGLLNVFGQKTRTVEAATGARSGETFRVTVPERLRSGLIYQATFEITAGEEGIKEPRLALSEGWADGSTLNSYMPQPVRELSSPVTGDTVWLFDSVPAGGRLTLTTSWQVNPTGPASRQLIAMLSDGDREIGRYDNQLEVFP